MARQKGEKLIAKNPTAFTNYFIEDKFEAGLVLTGTEIKSLRVHAPNLKDAFVDFSGKAGHLEAFLLNTHIAPYAQGNIWNHEPLRKRKLLLHAHEIAKLHGAKTQKGYTIIPTRLYLKNGYAKVEIGLAKGKKKHDRREDLKRASDVRMMDQARKRSR